MFVSGQSERFRYYVHLAKLKNKFAESFIKSQ